MNCFVLTVTILINVIITIVIVRGRCINIFRISVTPRIKIKGNLIPVEIDIHHRGALGGNRNISPVCPSIMETRPTIGSAIHRSGGAISLYHISRDYLTYCTILHQNRSLKVVIGVRVIRIRLISQLLLPYNDGIIGLRGSCPFSVNGGHACKFVIKVKWRTRGCATRFRRSTGVPTTESITYTGHR